MECPTQSYEELTGSVAVYNPKLKTFLFKEANQVDQRGTVMVVLLFSGPNVTEMLLNDLYSRQNNP